MSHPRAVSILSGDPAGVNTRGKWNSSAPDTAIRFWVSALLLFSVLSHCLSPFLFTRNGLAIHEMVSLLMDLQSAF